MKIKQKQWNMYLVQFHIDSRGTLVQAKSHEDAVKKYNKWLNVTDGLEPASVKRLETFYIY